MQCIFSRQHSLNLKHCAFLAAAFFFTQLLCNQSVASPLNLGQQLKVDSFSTTDGLTQASVFDIVQDTEGYIWFATQDGLNRFDGTNFTPYRTNAQNEFSLADNFVRNLFIDSHGTLWVGTQNGLSQYNNQLDNFTNYTFKAEQANGLADNFIWDIYQDNKQQLWVSTELGLHKFDQQSNQFNRVRVRTPSNSASTDIKAVKTIFQDNNNNYWFSSYEDGFYIFNSALSPNSALLKKIRQALGPNTTLINQINFLTSKKEYWLATNNGVFVLDQDYQLTQQYPLLPSGLQRTSDNIRANLNEPNTPNLTQTNVRTLITADNEQAHIWVGTDTGLKSISLLEESAKHYDFIDVKQTSGNQIIYSTFIDSANTLWLGTYDGLFSMSMQANTLQESKHLSPLLTGNTNSFVMLDSTIWLATENQLFSLSNNQAKPQLTTELSGNIEYLTSDNANLYFVTTNNKFYQYQPTSEKLAEHTSWQGQSNFDNNNPIKYFNDQIWYLNQQGQLTSYHITDKIYQSFNAFDSSFTAFHIDNNVKTNNSSNNSANNNLANNSANSTAKNIVQNPIIWLTTSNNQVMLFNVNNQAYQTLAINEPAHFSIKNTSSINSTANTIILGSESQGVLFIEKNLSTNSNSYLTTLFNEDSLLANNFVTNMVVDHQMNIWIATTKGISVINYKNKYIRSFYHDYGLAGNEYLDHSAIVDAQGTIYFGGTQGFHYFSPQALLNSEQAIYPPVLAELLIRNKKVYIAANQSPQFTLPARLNQLTNIKLNYDDWPITIEFIAPNAKLPAQVGYRYQLVGLDNDWIETSKNNLRATYTNVPAGDYHFNLEVYDKYDPSLKKSQTLAVHILAPWWLSQGALLIYGLFSLLVLAYFFQQLRHKRLYHMQIKLSEERLKLSLWGSGDEMWDWNINQGKIYRSNIWGILDFPQDGTRNVGNTDSNETNIHQKDIARITQALQEHFDQKTEHFEATYRVKDKDNQWIWVLDRGKVVDRDDQNKPTRMTGTLKDISQIKKADERLKLFAKCIENISDAVIIYDHNFNIVDVNKSYQRITGYHKKHMLGKPIRFQRYPERFTTEVKEHLLRKNGWHGEIESLRANGEIYLADLNIDIIRDENGAISHFVGVFSDITKRKQTEAELRRLANSDTLTGLPNRSYFQANQAILVKQKTPHALLIFDLDNFKKVNDSMGHEVGDVLLCKVAERMRKVGRKKDTVYRLGGDEFSLLIEDTNDIHTITTIAKNILTTIAQPLKLKSQEIVLYSSIGIVLYPEDGISPQELLKNADTAMYHAKHSGGNKYQFFSDSMNKKAVKRLQIENLIRHGLKEDFFSVFYQPKIEISTGKVAGMEALVRFETPAKGIISPVVFIPVSEETGQIIDIGEIVLRKACHATKAWIDAGLFDGRIAVNLSAVQFTQPNLVEMISEILKESQLAAKYLELEITEGTVMDSPQKAIETMLQIRAMGIHLSLDDFGTGYSSLAYLKKFPLNTLKIDKAFVDDIEESEQGRNMVATIVTIAHNLGLQVVAEGVETNQQLSFLSGLRCEQLQGYLYSKPLAQHDFRRYLLSHQITDKSTSFNR